MEIKVITFGVFDLFHFGHLRFLANAKALGNKLIVGVCSDELVYQYKGIVTVIPEDQRLQIVSAIRYVDEAFLETKADGTGKYIDHYEAEIFAVGEDWNDSKIETMTRAVCFMPSIQMIARTPGISSQAIKDAIGFA